jgi:hypothetical protein
MLGDLTSGVVDLGGRAFAEGSRQVGLALPPESVEVLRGQAALKRLQVVGE